MGRRAAWRRGVVVAVGSGWRGDGVEGDLARAKAMKPSARAAAAVDVLREVCVGGVS